MGNTKKKLSKEEVLNKYCPTNFNYSQQHLKEQILDAMEEYASSSPDKAIEELKRVSACCGSLDSYQDIGQARLTIHVMKENVDKTLATLSLGQGDKEGRMLNPEAVKLYEESPMNFFYLHILKRLNKDQIENLFQQLLPHTK